MEMLLGGPASCCQNGILRPGLPLAGLLPMGLDRTGTPPTMGISSPTLQLMWLLPVLSFVVICLCNFCPFPGWWAPERRDCICSVHCPQGSRTVPGRVGTQHGFVGWVGGWSQPSRELHRTSARFSHGLLLQLFKEKSLVLPHHLTAVPPKADSHPSCDVCQDLPSFPITEPSPATHCISSPLLCEFQRGCRWVWAVTLIPSPGFSEHGGGGGRSERSQASPALWEPQARVTKTSGSAHCSVQCPSALPTQPWPGGCKRVWQWLAVSGISVDTQDPALCHIS